VIGHRDPDHGPGRESDPSPGVSSGSGSGSGSDRDGPDDDPIVALDASALMAPVEAEVRLFDELGRLLTAYDPVVPAAVLDELNRLAGKSGAGTAAAVGADLAARAETVEADTDIDADTGAAVDGDAAAGDAALLALAAAGEVDYVVTNDRPLRDRLLARNVPVIGLRGRNALAITEP
jgi:rRNA-processing protein FCF1